MQVAEAETRARIKALQQTLEQQSVELKTYFAENEALSVSAIEREKELRLIRGADSKEYAVNAGKAPKSDKRRTSNGPRKNRTAEK